MDLLFMVDATFSMHAYLKGVADSLPQILIMSKVTGFIKRIAIMAYRDHDQKDLIEFSGWSEPSDLAPLEAFMRGLSALGGWDAAEAVKSAMNKAFEVVDCDGKTLLVLYTDAPPHHASMPSCNEHLFKEVKSLGAEAFDWVNICHRARSIGIQAYCMVDNSNWSCMTCWYALLAEMTNGGMLSLMEQVDHHTICRQTVGLFLAWLGCEHDFGNAQGLSLCAEAKTLMAQSRLAGERHAGELRILPELRRSSMLGPQIVRTSVSAMEKRLLPLHKSAVQVRGQCSFDATKRLHADPEYQAAIIKLFDDLLQPHNIDCLLYNTLFGQLWRGVCKLRHHPDRERLMLKMGNAVGRLPATQKANMKSYIEASYDQSDVIYTMIEDVDGPFLVLETPAKLQRSDVLEISRSCHPAIVRKVATLLTGLRIVPKAQSTTTLPYNMKDEDLFACLPHLMCPGTMMSRRPAALLAIIAASSSTDSPLFAKANNYLASIKGRWIDRSLPENVSLDLARLLLRCPSALTDEELQLYQQLFRVGSLRINGLTSIDAVVGYTSNQTKRPDSKMRCLTCSTLRSSTLIADDGKCAMCICEVQADEPAPDDRSIWCECHTCKVHYAVIRPGKFTKPKCHFCRHSLPVPKRQCHLCHNYFLMQMPCTSSHRTYTCPPCHDNGAAVTDCVTLTMSQYVKDNGLQGLRISDPAMFWSGRSLMHVKDLVIEDANARQVQQPTVHHKTVHNAADIQQVIDRWLHSGQAEMGTCCLCYEDMPKTALRPFCGRRHCDAQGCKSCVESWYGAFRPGAVLVPPNLFCAFCKKAPSPHIIRKVNPKLHTHARIDLTALDPAFYHGWCQCCDQVKPAVVKECSEDVPVLTSFKCTDCNDKGNIVTKDCPWCSVSIIRAGGCGHIHCTNCDKHFCWMCLYKAETSDPIYNHMNDAHSSFGYGHDNAEDDYRSDEEDDWY